MCMFTYFSAAGAAGVLFLESLPLVLECMFADELCTASARQAFARTALYGIVWHLKNEHYGILCYDDVCHTLRMYARTQRAMSSPCLVYIVVVVVAPSDMLCCIRLCSQSPTCYRWCPFVILSCVLLRGAMLNSPLYGQWLGHVLYYSIFKGIWIACRRSS